MAQEFSRTQRLGEQIRRELAELIRRLKDPRIGMVTITEVEVTRDLSLARVYYSVMEDDPTVQADTQAGLEHAAGFLRRELGKSLHVRVIPQLRFIFDDTQRKAEAIDRLIEEALNKDRH